VLPVVLVVLKVTEVSISHPECVLVQHQESPATLAQDHISSHPDAAFAKSMVAGGVLELLWRVMWLRPQTLMWLYTDHATLKSRSLKPISFTQACQAQSVLR